VVYRSTHHHTIRYQAGERVLWQGTPAVVTEGGFKFGALSIEWNGVKIDFSPYDLVWPEKVF
jgi:hypothetical protein